MAHEDNGIFRDDPSGSLSKRVREEVAAMDIRTLKAGAIPGNPEEAERYIQYCKHLCESEAQTLKEMFSERALQ